MEAAAPTTTNGVPGQPVTLTRANVKHFLKQFDTIVSDIDGVMWKPTASIPNVREALQSFKAAGKKILFATNNSLRLPFGAFDKLGFRVEKNEVVYPALALAWHLKRTGFKRKAYVLGTEVCKDFLRTQGVEVLPDRAGEERIGEDFFSVMAASQDDPDVGAVIVDVDVNLTYIQLTRAINYLRRPDCLFFAGASDSKLVLSDGHILIGPGLFLRIMEECTGRKAELVGKPGPMMVSDYLKEVHEFDIHRSLFVGDTLVQDMGVANACGMKKLLVLTGMTQLDDLKTCDPELLPDYIIQSFGDFADLLSPTKL